MFELRKSDMKTNYILYFLFVVLSCPVVLGYAMTETSSCGTLGTGSDLTVGRVGSPVQCTQVRLVDWEEGGYRTTDEPYPRGEIVMGGDNIAMGYYKNYESTDFFEEDGRRWIRTGDIGEVHPDGVFKIIGELTFHSFKIKYMKL